MIKQADPKSENISHSPNLLVPLIKSSLGFIFFFFLFEIVVNTIFSYPKDPQNTSPGFLSLYFDYGRSIEGKVFRQIGQTKATSAPLAQAGWLGEIEGVDQPRCRLNQTSLFIASYGMSFSNYVADALKRLDSNILLRKIAGPAAPPNHSYAAYKLDKDNHDADIVIFGILASSVRGLNSMSGMTLSPEVPPPFTFPAYYLENGQLKSISPSITSFNDLQMAKQDPKRWQEFVNQLRENDKFYDSFVFNRNFLDYSATARLIRRAWSKRVTGEKDSYIYSTNGFNQDWEQVSVLRAMIKDFSAQAAKNHQFPIILLISDQGFSNDLFTILEKTIVENKLAYINTDDIVPNTNRANFVGDGHFTQKANKKIAEQTLMLIKENYPVIQKNRLLREQTPSCNSINK